MNNNICVNLGKRAHKVFIKGVLKTHGEQKTIKNWLDSKIESLSFDDKAEVLFKTDGSYIDKKVSKRYTKGFQDIVLKHFI